MSDKSKDLPAHECFLLKRAEHAFKPTKGAGLTFGLFWCGNFTIIKSLSLLGCAIWEANIKIKTILKVVVVQRYYIKHALLVLQQVITVLRSIRVDKSLGF